MKIEFQTKEEGVYHFQLISSLTMVTHFVLKLSRSYV
jgi:hypothetical protein